MRIGIVSKWFASGQGVVSRQLRSALEQLGHETVVLARPGRGPRGNGREHAAERSDPVWMQPGVSEASAHEIPAEEYASWAQEHGIEVLFCDENYGFDELASLRRERGVRTIGRFVWESFAPADVDGARAAYDAVYSLTRCEQGRYGEIGLESFPVRWGIHPELIAAAGDAPPRPSAPEPDIVRYLFPAGFLGPRRPVRELLRAFRRVENPSLRLLLCAQLPRRAEQLRRAAERDPRVELILEEQSTAEYLRLFGRSDVCLLPTRWEGLGVPLFEATAFGLPIVTNDDPPMNELVGDGLNGLLVGSRPGEPTKSGLLARDPDEGELGDAIEALADPALRARLADGARAVREQRDWRLTVDDLGDLLDYVT